MTTELLEKAHTAVAERAVMVSTPAAVKAFMLKLLELLHLLDSGQYPRNHSGLSHRVRRMLGLRSVVLNVGSVDKDALHMQAGRAVQLQQVWRRAVAVIDEVDVVLHPLRSELNWPLGDKYALDFAAANPNPSPNPIPSPNPSPSPDPKPTPTPSPAPHQVRRLQLCGCGLTDGGAALLAEAIGARVRSLVITRNPGPTVTPTPTTTPTPTPTPTPTRTLIPTPTPNP